MPPPSGPAIRAAAELRKRLVLDIGVDEAYKTYNIYRLVEPIMPKRTRTAPPRKTKTTVGAAFGARVPASKVRESMSDTLNRVAYGGERIVLHRHGKDIAAIVPVEDLVILEVMEDRVDVREARKRLAEARAKAERPIPLDEVKRRLGL